MRHDDDLTNLLGSGDAGAVDDPGCDAGIPLLDLYVEVELAGGDPAARFPGTALHLRNCPDCRSDHAGILEAARHFD